MAGNSIGRRTPVVALAMGDPAGISPELTAKLLALDEVQAAAPLSSLATVACSRTAPAWQECALDVNVIGADAPLPGESHQARARRPRPPRSRHHQARRGARAGGLFAKENFLSALALAMTGAAMQCVFTPFNKCAMKLAVPTYDDEISFIANAIGFKGKAREFNVLDGLWNARITSHVPLAAVPGLLSVPVIVRGLELTDAAMSAAGFSPPRIAVAALNPHAGDNGNFGREEIDVIGPAVSDAKARGIACDGPYPSDTVFVRAAPGQFDAVLTMFTTRARSR